MWTESWSSPSSPRATVSSARHRDDSLHNWNRGGCGIGCPTRSKITNQCQENKVKHKLALHNWTWEMYVCRVLFLSLKELRERMCVGLWWWFVSTSEFHLLVFPFASFCLLNDNNMKKESYSFLIFPKQEEKVCHGVTEDSAAVPYTDRSLNTRRVRLTLLKQ